jgi:hypothetical protein
MRHSWFRGHTFRTYATTPTASHTVRNLSPQWLIEAGVRERISAAVTLGETSIMPGQQRDQIIRTPQQAIWLADEEFSFGFLARAMVALKMVAATNEFAIMRPGVAAAELTFALGVELSLDVGSEAEHVLITTEPLPSAAENQSRLDALPFCA